jgi:hypothetical protein
MRHTSCILKVATPRCLLKKRGKEFGFIEVLIKVQDCGP